MRDSIFKTLLNFFMNRLVILIAAVCVLFYILTGKLFQLQIVEGETYLQKLSSTIAKDVSIPAQRGSIYDRYGRPLAVNQFAYSVIIDPSVTMSDEDLNKAILNLIELLEENGEAYIDDLPISAEEPYTFTFSNDEDKTKETNWKKNQVNVDISFTATQTIEALRNEKRFNIGSNYTNEQARKIVSIRSKMYMVRFYSYTTITIASNVNMDTVTRITEDPEKFKSIDVDKEAMRYYPEGKYMSHIVGYTGRITSDDNVDTLLEKGYSTSDLIGKTGIESAFEDNLRGVDGKLTVIVNTYGRKVSEIEGSREEATQGDKVFLTIDANLQRQCYDILVDSLKTTIIAKLTTTNAKAVSITPKELLASLVKANNISAKDVFESSENSIGRIIKDYVLSIDPEANVLTSDSRVNVNKIISEGIDAGDVSVTNTLLLLHEQGIITGDENYIARIKSGNISAKQVLVDKITEDEITPQMANVDPCSASLVVVDPKTGDILAAPTYPTYDSNEFITDFNTIYPKLLIDPTKPLINRPFMEPRAPGSTFKMISAVTGLESSVIAPTTKIRDEIIFTKAGTPYSSCWNKSGHGLIDVEHAIEGSCNYFFYETLYRIGNSKNGNKLDSINTLNKYMSLFALDEGTGVEIGESYKEKSINNLSSPAYKEALYANNAYETTEWTDGNTLHTAIGQGFNNYTPAVMARYVSIVANKGEKYDFHLLNKIITEGEEREYVPIHTSIGDEISDDTWDILHSGMLRVTKGNVGTAKSVFADFPIDIGAKTGTAQEVNNRPDHLSFACFAPYDNPEVVVYVSIPFGDTAATAAPTSVAAKEVLSAYFHLESEVQEPELQNALAQ